MIKRESGGFATEVIVANANEWRDSDLDIVSELVRKALFMCVRKYSNAKMLDDFSSTWIYILIIY